jgi:SAM-dependent methyltransferase
MNKPINARDMLRLNQQHRHAMLPQETHDERARAEAIKAFRGKVGRLFFQGGRAVFEKHVKPAVEKAQGHPMKDHHEARKALRQNGFFQTVTAMRRVGQEMMWSTVIDTVEREAAGLIAKSKDLIGKTGGSLMLDEKVSVPAYNDACDIHVMPGGYHTDRLPDDITQGAILDRGAFIYHGGFPGRKFDAQAKSSIFWLKQHYAQFAPQHILDMGCSVGHASVALSDAFPGAEVTGIDVGAPCLRYGAARAAAYGNKVHFAQMNAEKTSFPDASFDLVYSHILFHETSLKAIPNIITECFRLLKPGGMMLHADLPNINLIPDLYQRVCVNEDNYDNNEPFWMTMHDRDWAKDATDAGFTDVKLTATPLLIALPPENGEPDGEERLVPGQLMFTVLAATKKAS